MLAYYQGHQTIANQFSLNEMITDQMSPNDFRGLLNLISDQNASKQQIPKNLQPSNGPNRKAINKWLFMLFCSTYAMLGFNLWFIVFVKIPIRQLNPILFSVQSIFASAIRAIVSYQISPSLKEAYNMLILLDDIFLNASIASIAFTHLIIILDHNNSWDFKLYIPFYLLEVIFMLISIKCTMLYLSWTKLQVIVMKFIFMFLVITFFSLGVYYILTRKSFVQIVEPNLIETMNKYLILFFFCEFNNCLEIYKKFSTFDGTNHLRYDYFLINLHSQRENTIFKQKFIRFKKETLRTLFSIKNKTLNKKQISNFKKSIFFEKNNLIKAEKESLPKEKIDQMLQKEDEINDALQNIVETEKEQSEKNMQTYQVNGNLQQSSKGYTINVKPFTMKNFRVQLRKQSFKRSQKIDEARDSYANFEDY